MKANMALEVCKKCKAACCRMGGPDFSEYEMRRVLKKVHKNFFIKIGGNHYESKCKKGICPYLTKDNSCSIHKTRPLMCKVWPLTVNYKSNKKELMIIECPLTPLLSKQDIRIMKKQINHIPKEMLHTSFSRSKLSKSDLKLIKKRYAKFKKKVLKATK